MNELYDAGTVRRMRRITVTAVFLLFLGFVLPIASNSFFTLSLDWFGMDALTNSETPWAIKIYLLMPLITAIMGLVALFLRSDLAKTILVGAAAFIPLAFILIAGQLYLISNSSEVIGRAMQLGPELVSAGMIQWVGLYLGPLGMYVGANASLLNPKAKIPVHVAFGGSLLFAVGLLIPVTNESGKVVSGALIWMEGAENAPLFSIVALLITGCLFVAIAVTIVWWAKRNQGAAQGTIVRRLLNVSFWLILSSVLGYILWIMITAGHVASIFLGVAIIIAKLAIPALAWYQLKVVCLSPISAR